MTEPRARSWAYASAAAGLIADALFIAFYASFAVQHFAEPHGGAARARAEGMIGGIAAHFGITDWHKVWDDPKNAGLRAHRIAPEHVQPGDAVWVPAP